MALHIIDEANCCLNCKKPMCQQGYGVTIFEWKDKIGGIMQYGIPEFRLPKSILDRYQIRLQELDVKVRPNTTIGAVLKIEDLLRDGYASVFIGTGVWKTRNLGIKGECLGNVFFGIDYLANASAYDLGEKVAVIGMGNAAMDVARTALRNGAHQVTMYARGTHVVASSHEVAYTKLDGAEFVFGYGIQEINEKGPVFKKSVLNEEGKLIRTTLGLKGSEKGLLIVDENYMTTKEGVFAAGDVISGSKTVVHAVDGAKKAADAMIKYMEEIF